MVLPNDGMPRTALIAAADAGREAHLATPRKQQALLPANEDRSSHLLRFDKNGTIFLALFRWAG